MSLYGVEFELLDNLDRILEVFERAVEVLGANVINRFSHKFHPQGVTVVYALAESHLSLHSFPENGCVALDVYTCGNMDSKGGVDVFVNFFNPREACIQEIRR